MLRYVLLVAPIVYAAAFNVRFHVDDTPFNSPDTLFGLALVGLKILAVVSLLYSLGRIGQLVGEQRQFAGVAATVWAIAGTALVLVVAAAKNRGRVLSSDQLWPGHVEPTLLDMLSSEPGTDWQPYTIVVFELIAVALLATLTAAAVAVLAPRLERALVTAIASAGVFLGLLIYDRLVSWPVMFDFDFFVGDAVLGAATYEVGFVFLPVDTIGALAFGTAGLANLTVLALAKLAHAATR